MRVEVARPRGDVHVGRRQLAPGQVEERVQQAADDGDLRAHRRRLPELARARARRACARPARGRPRRRAGGSRRCPRRLVAGLLDLVADDAQLLVQQQLALGALDAVLHLLPISCSMPSTAFSSARLSSRASRRCCVDSDLEQRLLLVRWRSAGARPRCRRARPRRRPVRPRTAASSASCGFSCT